MKNKKNVVRIIAGVLTALMLFSMIVMLSSCEEREADNINSVRQITVII